ncbi:MAG: hypothetical protein AB7P16_22285, partial [Bradyrhizobium sp.]
MADRTVKVTYVISDDGTLRVLDEASRKVRQVGEDARAAATKSTLAFTDLQAKVIALNQGLALVQQAAQTAARFINEFAVAPLQGIDAFKELSNAIGLSVEDLTSLRVAAKLGGAELSELGRNVVFFQRQLDDARRGGAKLSIFEQLGVDIGRGRATLDILADTGAKLSTLSDTVRRTAAATELFGRGGGRALNVFNAELRENIELNNRMGLTITGSVARSAERTADDIDKLSLSITATREQFAIGFTPAIRAATAALNDLNGASQAVGDSAEQTKSWAQTIGEALGNGLAFQTKKAAAEYGVLFEALAMVKRGAGEAATELGETIAIANKTSDIELAADAWLKYWAAVRGQRQAFADRSPLGAIGQQDPNLVFGDPFTGTGFEPIPDPFLGGFSPDPRLGSFGDPFSGTGTQRFAGPTDDEIADAQQRAEDARRRAEEARARAQRSSEASAEARVIAEQSALKLLEQQLESVDSRLSRELALADTQAERLAAAAAGEAQLLALAEQQDARQRAVLDAEIAVLAEKKKQADITAGEQQLLDAQIAALNAERDALGNVSGEAVKVRDRFVDIREEIERANRVTLDLGATLNSSVIRAADALLTRGDFDLSNLITDSGKALASSFIGGLLEAQAAKDKFDVQVAENFSVTLPGFMRDGVESITDIWRSGLDLLGLAADDTVSDLTQSFDSGFKQIQSGAQNTAKIAAALTRNAAAGTVVLQGATVATTQIAGAQASQPVLDSFGNIVGFESSASGVGQSSTGATGVLGGGGGAGGGFDAGSISLLAGVGIAGIAGTIAGPKSAVGESAQLGAALGAAGGLVVGTAIGSTILPGIGTVVGAIVGIVVGSIIDAVQQKPTTGSIVRQEVDKLFFDTGLPRQQVYKLGEAGGLRSVGLDRPATQEELDFFSALIPRVGDQVFADRVRADSKRLGLEGGELEQDILNAPPGVSDIRKSEGFALGLTLTEHSREAFAFANTVANNFALLDVSVEEARRQLAKAARAAGVTVESGIEEIQKKYLMGKLYQDDTTPENESAQQLFIGIEGLVKLFEDDLPAGIDVAAIAMKHFTDEAGVDIAGFNKELERTKDQLKEVEQAVEIGLRNGLPGATRGFAEVNRLTAAGRPAADIEKEMRNARVSIQSSLADSIREGMIEGVETGLYNSIQDSPAWDALTEAVGKAVAGGDMANIPLLIGDVVSTAMPALVTAAEIIQQIQDQLGVTPGALYGASTSIEEQIEGRRFNALTPRNREKKIRADLAATESELNAILADGVISESEAVRAEKLLRKKAELGFQLADEADARYAPGSVRGRRQREEGLGISQEAADQFEAFGIQQEQLYQRIESVTEQNTSTTEANTASVREN